ncbi:MAG: MarR family transcriptional regulator [Pseudomonadales bacterium]|nr:MarR family transcriptional regulator [Pseudomonadales bacterium]NIX06753.1 MarR family transcriptional regulator [Pseudomonadales bacterium]
MSASDETTYLDPLNSVGYLSRINFRAFSRALEKLTLEYGVSSGQWRFLRVLWDADGVTQRELSELAGTTEATTVRAVDRLVRSGLVTREPSRHDRRKVHVFLTKKGQCLRDKLIPMVVQVNERALAGISDKDIETTRRVLATTFANLTEPERRR